MTKVSNEIGDSGEDRVADALGQGGARRVPMSGGGHFYKLDVKDDEFIISIKATRNGGVRLTRDLWQEVKRAIRGPRGSRSGIKPAFIAVIDDEPVIVLRLTDFIGLATGEIKPYIAPSKGAARVARFRKSRSG